MYSPSHTRQSTILDSPSQRRQSNHHSPSRMNSSYHSESRFSTGLPSTTPLKSPGNLHRNSLSSGQGRSLEDSNAHQSIPPSIFKVPTFLNRPPLSTIRRRASEESAKTLGDNSFSRSGSARPAHASVIAAEKSLQALRQSQRRSLESSTAAIMAKAPLLRTTETEYDVSPNRAARLLSTPVQSSYMGTPTRKPTPQRRPRSPVQNLQSSPAPPSPLDRHSGRSARNLGHYSPPPPSPLQRHSRGPGSGSREDSATLAWVQGTEALSNQHRADEQGNAREDNEYLDQRYTRRTSIVDNPLEAREHDRHSSNGQGLFENGDDQDNEVSYRRRDASPRRSLTRSQDHARQSSDHDQDLLNSQAEDAQVPYGFHSPSATPGHHAERLDPRTPEMVANAEDSLLEVAETTTSLTHQLRGVYTNLQEFFSPETEAKLNGAMSVIGSTKANRTRQGLSSSQPRPLNFRSTSVRKDFRSTVSSRPLTEPIPFNFSERLSRLPTRQASHSVSTPTSKFKRPIRHTGAAVAIRPPESDQESDIFGQHQENASVRAGSPMVRHRTFNEFQEMSKSPFVPLAQRTRLLGQRASPTDSVGKTPLTTPKSPNLLTRSRYKATPAELPYEERVLQDIVQHGGYKAHSVDRRVFESSGDLGVPKVAKPPLTVPKSPAFTRRKPAPLRPAVVVKHTPATSSGHQRQYRHHAGITERGLVSSAESSRRLSHERNRQLLKNASVRRDHEVDDGPVSNKIQVTIPAPFSFETDARGERYQDQFKSKLGRWKQIEKEHQFKALPLPVYPELFVPKKSTKPLTHTEPVVLRTDKRPEERQAFERERRQKEKMMEDMRAEKAREDELRLRRHREQLVVHPTPIRDYPRIEIHKSTRPLTVPKSPRIGDKRRRVEESEEPAAQQRFEESVLDEAEYFSRSGYDSRQEHYRQEIEQQRVEDERQQREKEYQQQQQQPVYHESYEPYSDYSKRPRIEGEPNFGRRMGRKSWLEANDL